MEELFLIILLIILVFIIYNYQIYKNSKKKGSCSIVYKPME